MAEDLFAIVRSVFTMVIGLGFLYFGYIILMPVYNGMSNVILAAGANLPGVGAFVQNISTEIGASFIIIGIIIEVYGFVSAFRREPVPSYIGGGMT